MERTSMRPFFIFPVTAIFIVAFLPFLVSAAGIVPCDGPDCDFPKLILLGQNIINYLILLSIPLAAVAFAYCGFLFLTAAGNESQIKKAKGIGWHVLWGFLAVLSAWLIVYFITQALLSTDY